MRTLFYLLDGQRNASSFHRVVQYVPLLRAHGIEAQVAAPPLYDRLIDTGQMVNGVTRGVFYSLFLATRTLDVLRARQFDVVVIQRDLFPFGPPLLERILRKRNPRLVYDTDDATYERPSFTPRTPFQRLRRFDKVAEVVRTARWVSVATEPIAAWARQYSSHVSVVPMALDMKQYPERAEPTRITLGWAGTKGGLRYVHGLTPTLRTLARQHDITFKVISGGYRNVCLPGVPLEARPWRLDSQIADLSTLSIGLVPLDDTPFERAKFPFKLLQYMALGIPVVSARVGVAADVIVDGQNGLLASSADEWTTQLARLIGDPALRARLGAAGRETVADRYTVERVGPLLADGLLSAAR